jgi:hypothetical protein
MYACAARPDIAVARGSRLLFRLHRNFRVACCTRPIQQILLNLPQRSERSNQRSWWCQTLHRRGDTHIMFHLTDTCTQESMEPIKGASSWNHLSTFIYIFITLSLFHPLWLISCILHFFLFFLFFPSFVLVLCCYFTYMFPYPFVFLSFCCFAFHILLFFIAFSLSSFNSLSFFYRRFFVTFIIVVYSRLLFSSFISFL